MPRPIHRFALPAAFGPRSASQQSAGRGVASVQPLTMKSSAYQSDQASPIAPGCAPDSAPTPLASVTSRFERPWVYSWKTIEASSPAFESTIGAPPVNRYICIAGDCPSGGVHMFALFLCEELGLPLAVAAPSSISASRGSAPSKFPLAAVKPMGAAAR